MNRLFMGILVVALLAGVGTVSAAPNLVLNGGFEAPALPDNLPDGFQQMSSGLTSWAIGPGNIDLTRTYWTPAEGLQSIDLSGSRRGTIKQDITTQPGKSYDLSFALAGNPVGLPTVKSVEVFWNGVSQGTTPFSTAGRSRLSMGWVTVTRTELPASAGTSTELKFVDQSADNGFYGAALDNIIVTEHQPIPAPEFPAIALPVAFVIGIIGAVFYIRSSREE